jgi:hypothetical protein
MNTSNKKWRVFIVGIILAVMVWGYGSNKHHPAKTVINQTATTELREGTITLTAEWSEPPIICGNDGLEFFWAPINCVLEVRDLRFPEEKVTVDRIEMNLPRHISMMQWRIAAGQPQFNVAVVGYKLK